VGTGQLDKKDTILKKGQIGKRRVRKEKWIWNLELQVRFLSDFSKFIEIPDTWKGKIKKIPKRCLHHSTDVFSAAGTST
jgi:hypothetical protein